MAPTDPTTTKGSAPGTSGAQRVHARRTKPAYPPEFRAEAVRLARTHGTSRAQLSRELGISQDTLRAWVRQAEIDGGRRDGLTTEERQELSQLRRDVKRLEEEREILKKAAAFFAAESTTRWTGRTE